VSSSDLYIGLISGTSRDGVDAALVSIDHHRTTVHSALCHPYPATISESLAQLLRTGSKPCETTMKSLDLELADHFSATVAKLLSEAGVAAGEIKAIGSHGQTVWHDPDGPIPETIQLGSLQRIFAKTGIVTVGNFRVADVLAGGQGAPLAPLLHQALFRPAKGCRVVLNLGGIANISVIDEKGSVSGYDTGPANCLMDGWIQSCRKQPFDRDGTWAAGGRVNEQLLARLLMDPYFEKAPPKSTGLEYFHLHWLEQYTRDQAIDERDMQATLAELTAVSVARSIRVSHPGDVLVCGGGVHNVNLIKRLRANLPGVPLRSTAVAGLDPDWVEAVLFAWLARERLAQRPQDTRTITGARHSVLLGEVES